MAIPWPVCPLPVPALLWQLSLASRCSRRCSAPTDAFNQRLQFAIYPTYVTQTVQNNQERTSGRVPPQLALVTDVGVAITDRFDFSVLAAPDRNDLPSQTLTYQINPRTSVSASVDTQGTWQSSSRCFCASEPWLNPVFWASMSAERLSTRSVRHRWHLAG